MRHRWPVVALIFVLTLGTTGFTHLDAGELLFAPDREDARDLERSIRRIADEIASVSVHVECRERMGSGTLVDPDGLVLTSAHVVEGRALCTVTTSEGRRYRAKVLGLNLKGDIGLLKIESKTPFPAARIHRGTPEAGDWVLGAGHPISAFYDREPSLGLGRLRDLHRSVIADGGRKVLRNLLASDFPTAPGGSGGGLFDRQGRLIGIVCAISLDEEECFCIRIAEFLEDRERLIKGEIFDRAAPRLRERRHRRFGRARWFRAALRDEADHLNRRQLRFEVNGQRFTGLLVSARGEILTIAEPFVSHRRGQSVSVRVADGRRLQARFVDWDREEGLAYLQLEGATPVPDFFDLDEIARCARGSLALAIDGRRARGGVVVAPERWPPLDLEVPPGRGFPHGVLQADLRLSHEALGGGVVTRGGKLLGLVIQHRLEFAPWSRARKIDGSYGALVLPAARLRESLRALRAGSRRAPRSRAFLGVQLQELSERERGELGVGAGILVSRLAGVTTPAARAGLQRGDLILSANGQPVYSFGCVMIHVARSRPGEPLLLRIRRDGKERELRLILGKRPGG